MRAVEIVLFLVVVATIVATFARRINVPAPSLLVLAGIAVALIPGTPSIEVTPEIVGLVVLPPLLYAAGEELSWRELRFVWRPVTILAVGLVIASAAAVGAVTVWLTVLPAGLAFVLGAVLASTDPVAVSALGRRLSLPPRLQTLVQGESLFNDATSLILFRISLGIALAGTVSWGRAAGEFAVLALGGIGVGAVVAGGVALIRARTRDPVLESVIALVTPYVAYVLAELVHASGVTAVVVAAVTLGALRPRLTTPSSRLQLAAVYPTVIFLLESVVFGLIGLELPGLIRRLAAEDESWIMAAIAISATLLVIRVAWVLPIAALAHRRTKDQPRRRIWQVTAVVAWAGTRGVVPLAAALSIPRLNAAGQPLAGRDLVLVLAVAVIAISLIVQGFTLSNVVGRSGLALHASEGTDEIRSARRRIVAAAGTFLDQVRSDGAAPPEVVDQVRRLLPVAADDAGGADDEATNRAYERLRHAVIEVRTSELARMYADQEITDATFHQLQRQLDLEHAHIEEA